MCVSRIDNYLLNKRATPPGLPNVLISCFLLKNLLTQLARCKTRGIAVAKAQDSVRSCLMIASFFLLQPIKHCSELYSWISLCVLYIETMSSQLIPPQSSLDTMGLWVCSMCVIICESTLRVYERKRGMGVTDSLMVTVAESWCLRAIQWQSYTICGMSLL